MPYPWAYDTWSFAVPAVNQEQSQPGTWADFSAATVTVTQNGTPVPINYYVPAQTVAFDNAILWTFVNPIARGAGMPDTPYTVTIDNVRRTAQSRYTYTVTIIDARNAAADECRFATVVRQGINGPYDNLTATTDALPFACANASNEVWFGYTATCNGTTTFSTCGAALTFDTALEVFAGSDCNNLTLVACNDDSACGIGSSVSIITGIGLQYRIRVGGYRGARGNFDLTVATTGCTGSFQRLAHRCGAATIAYSGTGTVGTTTTFTLNGVTGAPVLFLGGALLATPLCPGCTLGPNPQVLFGGANLPLAIPTNNALIGGRIYVQGADVGATGGCAAPQLTLTDTIEMTIG